VFTHSHSYIMFSVISQSDLIFYSHEISTLEKIYMKLDLLGISNEIKSKNQMLIPKSYLKNFLLRFHIVRHDHKTLSFSFHILFVLKES
jgi:hypothetical protein